VEASKNPAKVLVDSSMTLVAMFAPVVHTLQANVKPSDGGAVYINGSALASQKVGDGVGIYAIADEGYRFKEWSGSSVEFGDKRSISTTVKLSADATITANFERGSGGGGTVAPPLICVLTTEVTPEGGGSVQRSPDLTNYITGTTVAVNAMPEEGYTFIGWTDAAAGTTNPTSVLMDGNKRVIATFQLKPKANQFLIMFNANGGTVTPTSALTDTSGYLASLPTPVLSGHTFNGWYTASSGGSPVTVDTKFTDNITIYAQWTATAPDTAKVPFVVNVSATVKASSGSSTVQKSVTAGTETVLSVPLSGTGNASWMITVEASGYADTVYTLVLVNGANTRQNITLRAVSLGGNVNTCTSGGSCKSAVMPDGKKWLTENLNIGTAYSWCYADSCAKYGRLYTWSAAKAACQSIGWRLPSNAEWKALVDSAGGYSVAGKKLKAMSGWNGYNNSYGETISGNGTDNFGFSALPGGYRGYSNGSFNNAVNYGYWWTATERGSGNAYGRYMNYGTGNVNEDHYDKDNGFSVRCVANN